MPFLCCSGVDSFIIFSNSAEFAMYKTMNFFICNPPCRKKITEAFETRRLFRAFMRPNTDPTRGFESRAGLRLRRLWPGPRLVGPNGLEGACDREHAEVVKSAPDDLQAYRQAFAIIAAIDGRGRLLGHIVGDGEAH